MRARFKAPSHQWRSGELTVTPVRVRKRHRSLRITLTSRDGETIVFEVQDRDIYRLANSITSQIEACGATGVVDS